MNKMLVRWLQWSVVIGDGIMINGAFLLTASFFSRPYIDLSGPSYAWFITIINLSWWTVAPLAGIYQEKKVLSFEGFMRATVHCFPYFLLLDELALFFFRLTLLSRLFVVIVLAAIFFALVAARLFYLLISHHMRKRHWLVDRVLIIGYNPLSKRLVGHLADDGVNKQIVGYCEEEENITELSGYPILGDIKGALEICRAYHVNEIYSTIAPEQNACLYELISKSEKQCIRFKLVPDLSFYVKGQMHIHYFKEMPILTLRREPLEDLGNRFRKRAFDLVVSGLVIAGILSWLVPLMALLIRVSSRGPVFFIQPRTGRNNQPFGCVKFRSMHVNEDADLRQATRSDQRVTRIGAFLRRTSLDELPQFLNVFKGDMSIIGPRPHMIRHTAEYARKIDRYMVRQFVKPGITGWAQIHGFRGETKNLWQMERRIEHDLWYLEHWSLFLDVRIMFLTGLILLKGDKNAF